MTTQSTAIELETIETTHDLLMGEALDRLRKNPDFKFVIEEGYLKDKILASVSLLSVPQVNQQGQRPAVMEDIIAASNLQYWFLQIDNFHEGAKNPVLSDEEEEELLDAQNSNGVN